MWVTKLMISQVKKSIFLPKTTKFGILGQFGPGHAGLFGALLVGRLVVVARGMYLARHLFTLCNIYILACIDIRTKIFKTSIWGFLFPLKTEILEAVVIFLEANFPPFLS